jgi:hypothetical protein
MPSATFYHYTLPVIAGGQATVRIHAETDEDPPRVLVEDQEGDEHQVSADPNELGARDKARAGCKAYVAQRGERMGIEVLAANVQEVDAP